MLIETAIPFTFFQHPAVERFLHALNPAWKAPCPKIFATKLLDDVYQSTKQEVEQILAKEDHLSICFNGSDSVSKHRIINISANTSKGAFYIKNLDAGAETIDAEFSAGLVEQEMSLLTNGDLKRCNAFATDTCSTQRSTWDKLAVSPNLSHAFMVPCDPHGLQLLIQDILEHPIYAGTVKQADNIVNHFHHAKKQNAILQELVVENCGGKTKQLIMSCNVRWGTYTGEFKRLIDVRQALRAFYVDNRVQKELSSSARAKDVATTISDPSFFTSL